MSDPVPVSPANPIQSPLTLVMKIKSEADFEQLSGMLQHFQGLPPDQNPIHVALDKLAIVHFARFVFLNSNTELAVITSYDGSFEDYINEFIDNIGDVFNALLAHVDGAPPLPVQSNRQAFLDYVKQNDFRGLDPFYSAYPNATVLAIKAALSNQ
jgi:hypothetical protein